MPRLPIYIVLELPEPIAGIVHKIRQDQGDALRASLPNEITVVRSSGLDSAGQNQKLDELFRIVDSVAASTTPITASFDTVHRFPGTDIVVLKLQDETLVRSLRQKLIDSGIQLQDVNFPYEPHCTLRSISPLTESELNQLSKLKIPDAFTLKTLSIYTAPAPMELLHSVELRSK